ncbi:hypothetical protein [Pararhodonellum marinum]|uniref:hypothetical protein n=1 Tax=Pararhodonellum marinum TaxID=2755358 RepID=UPI00188F35AA|nr:hypothetical protein [Pararhodonellum marinum]
MEIQILLQVVIIFIGLYLAFFKSYFLEKGKNIATNEDIEKLTFKVESIKQQFIEKNANLKAKLDMLTNLQISHKNDERLTLIDFHKNFKKWIGLLTESSPTLIDEYDNNEINSKMYFYDQVYQEVLSSEALLQLYVEDDILINLIFKLKTSTLENLAGHPTKFLIDLKYNNTQIELNNNTPIDSPEKIRKRGSRHRELLNERNAIYIEYRDKMIAGLTQTISIENEYLEYMKDYLKQISEESF